MLLGGFPEVCALRDLGWGGGEGAQELVWEEGVEEDPVWARGLAWELRKGRGANGEGEQTLACGGGVEAQMLVV